MLTGFYNLDGKDYEYVIDGKRIYDPNTGENLSRIWVYPVRQGVWGGDTIIKYFSTKEGRDDYIKCHDYCDKLPRCKVPNID